MKSKLLLVTISLFSLIAFAADEPRSASEVQKELESLEAEIQKFRDMLKRTEGERSELESSLQLNEQEINELLKRIQSIQTDLKKGEDRLSHLSEQQRQLQVRKADQQGQIAQQVRAAYELGQQPYLKVMLNQEDPQKLQRMLTYFNAINKARTDEIAAYESTITQLMNLEQLIAEQNQQLIDQRMQLQAEQQGLLAVRTEKQQVVALLSQEIRAAGNELERRLEDRQRLDHLLSRINAGIANLASPEDATPFADMKGSLLLPVAGEIKQNFGSRRAGGKLRWNGVLIEADEGDPVYAVHYGRVVFSDWLRGFGLLLIVSHGDGYMSLYGHNQVLYRETGDWVTAGETIATVGNTGGQLDHGVYFEIRSAGKPFDPKLWCQARPFSRAA